MKTDVKDGPLGVDIQHRWIEVADNLRLHVVEAGPLDGPLVLLLHGFPEFWWGWRHHIEPLVQAGFRVLVPDQRGYNESDKPQRLEDYHLDLLASDVVSLIRSTGQSKAHIVGHDWGALVAWWVASQFPDVVDRLVILNGPHPALLRKLMGSPSLLSPVTLAKQAAKSSYVGFFQIPRMPESLLSAHDFAALRWALPFSSRKGIFNKRDLDRYAEAWSKPRALTSMLSWYRALRLFSVENRATRITAPTLIFWGMNDQFLEPELAELSLRFCDQGELVRLEHATHWLHLEEPKTLASRIIAFVR